jgi:hypothetical protein
MQALYGYPRFTDGERLEYFALLPTEKAALEPLHSIKSRIYFILPLGYGKSHHMFFVFDLPDVEEDAWYVRGHYFPDVQLGDLATTKVTRLRQQRVILRYQDGAKERVYLLRMRGQRGRRESRAPAQARQRGRNPAADAFAVQAKAFNILTVRVHCLPAGLWCRIRLDVEDFHIEIERFAR